MAGKLGLGKFQITPGFTTWKGLTRENALASIFQSQPQKATELMVQLLASYKGKTLESFLAKFPTKQFDTADEYTWPIIGSHRRNIPIIEARDETGTPITTGMAGANVSPFYVVFAEDWFADGEVIVGELNEIYPLRVLGETIMEGTNAVYKVELMGGVTTGMPASELAIGKRFSIDYAPVEADFSREVGDIRFSSNSSMRNEFSTIRIKHKVGGEKLNKKIATGIPVVGTDGKKRIETMWMHYVDFELEQQFSDAKNNVLAFGRSNRTANGEYLNIGKSGGVIKMGAGLYEQMEVANTIYYNTFSLKLIEDALYDICSSKLPMNQRNFFIFTGERGALQFHKAVANTVSGWGTFTLNGDNLGVVRKTTSELNANSLAAGYQYTEYAMPNGCKVTVKVDPYYDDPVRNKVMHPNGGPAFSYRYDIFDIGSMDQPNIFKCIVKDHPEYRGYQWGPFRNPFTGAANNPYASFDEDAAVVHKMASLGICVLDPTRTLSLIPNILTA